MTTLLIWVHVLLVFLIVYHHIFYPILLSLIARSKMDSPQIATPIADADLPHITIVIPAYNEEKWIADKILNLSILDYPSSKLAIKIVCDGCTDNTVAIANTHLKYGECDGLDIEVIDHPINRGKVSLINETLPLVQSDIVALSDVSAIISNDALKIAAAAFQDPDIGVVNSQYRIYDTENSIDTSYWEYQSRIKEKESKIDSTLGAHGAFYIFRKSLFVELEADTINDDFILPMRIVAQGYKVKQISDIKALELESSNQNMDGQRRKRISAGNLQQIIRLKTLLLPQYKYVAFLFTSGKGLRVIMPLLMILAYLTNLGLVQYHVVFLLEFIVQNLIYGGVAMNIKWQITQNKYINMLSYLVSGHFNSLIGTYQFMLGQRSKGWSKITPED